MEMYNVQSIGGCLWEERIKNLVKYHQKRPWEGGNPNIYICLWGEKLIKGKFSSLLFSLQHHFPLNYIILHYLIYLLYVPLSN